MRYIPNSPEERSDMLRTLGLVSAPDLFRSLPTNIKLDRALDLPGPLSELELVAEFERIAGSNRGATGSSFMGAGAYAHYSPSIVDHLIQRSEFFTAYTPYQPEVSQGTLQVIFEFQTLVCQLTGMDVANASMYDGSTALAEAVLMAERITRRKKIVAAQTVHPEYLEVTTTYVQHYGLEKLRVGFDESSGRLDLAALSTALDQNTAALVVQSPNFFGCIEDVKLLAERAHEAGALLILAVTEAASFGLLKTPGACGVDILVAEGQSFGIPLSFGGPYLGLFATSDRFARQMPGRLVGEAFDKQGRRGYVLTLATREQHIRREKATSNICTNEGLIALAATIYLETMGRKGIREVAYQCLQKAAYAASQIAALPGFSIPFNAPRFNEFVVRGPVAAESLLTRLAADSGIQGGVSLSRYYATRGNEFLVCVTELNSRAQIDALAAGLHAAAQQ